MRIFSVQIPIAGHAMMEIEAEDEDGAIAKAFETVTIHHIEDWEALEQFHTGNVCYCPRPWHVVATDQGETK